VRRTWRWRPECSTPPATAIRPLADRTRRRIGLDGKCWAPDCLSNNEHICAVGAITAQHLEEALSARFGLEWVARDDGHGLEISGISGPS